MRCPARLLLAAVVMAAGPLLSACSSTSLDSLDPSEWFDTKKKLSGERKDVFPQGVPGVTSGVPPELVKGYREPEGGTVDPAKVAAEEAAASSDKPRKPPPQRTAAAKPKPKPKPAADSGSVSPAQPPPPAQGGGWPSPQQPAPWPGR